MELQRQHTLTPGTDVAARRAATLDRLREMVEAHASNDDMPAIIEELPSMQCIASQAVALVLLGRIHRYEEEAQQAAWERDLYE